MAIGIYFSPTGFSAAKYDECLKRLTSAGALHPKGRRYHASFGTPDNLMVFDVWDSQQSFDAFGQTLIPIMHAIGADPGQPSVMPINRIIVPPAKASKKRSAPKRASRAAGKRAKKATPARRRARR